MLFPKELTQNACSSLFLKAQWPFLFCWLTFLILRTDRGNSRRTVAGAAAIISVMSFYSMFLQKKGSLTPLEIDSLSKAQISPTYARYLPDACGHYLSLSAAQCIWSYQQTAYYGQFQELLSCHAEKGRRNVPSPTKPSSFFEGKQP